MPIMWTDQNENHDTSQTPPDVPDATLDVALVAGWLVWLAVVAFISW